MLKGVFIILLFCALGELCSLFIYGAVPGSVLGMLLLFFSLEFKLTNPAVIRPVVKVITNNMAIFFLPSMVSVMTTYPILLNGLLPIILAIAVSTAVVMVVVGLIFQYYENRNNRVA